MLHMAGCSCSGWTLAPEGTILGNMYKINSELSVPVGLVRYSHSAESAILVVAIIEFLCAIIVSKASKLKYCCDFLWFLPCKCSCAGAVFAQQPNRQNRGTWHPDGNHRSASASTTWTLVVGSRIPYCFVYYFVWNSHGLVFWDAAPSLMRRLHGSPSPDPDTTSPCVTTCRLESCQQQHFIHRNQLGVSD